MLAALHLSATALSRREGSGGCGSLGCFVFLVVAGLILFRLLKGRRDRPEMLGASKRAMGSGPIADHVFASPYAKCPACSASGDKMKQQWDGLRKVTWTCGYCGNVAGIQELKDEELPPSARQRLGLDLPPPSLRQDGSGMYADQGGSGVGGLLTGMMIGSMMSGGRDHHDHRWTDHNSGGDSGGGWGDSGGGDSGGDWGDSGGADSGGGDWGDSGGGDSGGSDW